MIPTHPLQGFSELLSGVLFTGWFTGVWNSGNTALISSRSFHEVRSSSTGIPTNR